MRPAPLLLALLLCLCAAPASAYQLTLTRGRLALLPSPPGQTDSREWHETADGVEWEDYAGRGYFNGSICVTASADSLTVAGRRKDFHDWEVIDFTLDQSSDSLTVRYTVRTPIGQPDVVFVDRYPSLTSAVIHAPGIRAILDELLADCGCDAFAFDPVSFAQVNPAAWHCPDGLAEKVAALLPALGSDDWRRRRDAVRELCDMGADAAIYLTRMGLDGLTAEQCRGIDEALSAWPKLTPAEVDSLRETGTGTIGR